MARGVNRVTLIGNVGTDPEVKYTQGGMAITKISLATTSVRKDRDGNQQESTQWHRVSFFGKLGEIAGEYLRKGSQVYVEGEIRYSEHTGEDGQKRYYTDIIGNEMQMLGGRGESRQDGEQRDTRQRSAGNNSQGNSQRGGHGQSGNSQNGGNGNGNYQPADFGGGGEFADDIPF